MNHKLESRLPGEISTTLDIQITPPLWQKAIRNRRASWWRWKKSVKKLNIQKTNIMASGPIISWQIDWETMETVTDFIFLGSKITADSDCSHEIKTLALWKKSYDKPRQHIKKQRYHFANKNLYSQSYGFSSNHVWVWELDHKESWALKNWLFRAVVLKTLESPLDNKEIQPVNPKRNQSWIFTGRSEAEAPILWPPGLKSQLIGKDPVAGKDWGQVEKGTTEDEVVEWHHWLNRHELEQTLGDSEGQGSLMFCSPWGHKELDMT